MAIAPNRAPYILFCVYIRVEVAGISPAELKINENQLMMKAQYFWILLLSTVISLVACQPQTSNVPPADPLADSKPLGGPKDCAYSTSPTLTTCASDTRVMEGPNCARGWCALWAAYTPAFGLDSTISKNVRIPLTTVSQLMEACPSCNTLRLYFGIHIENDHELLSMMLVNVDSAHCEDVYIAVKDGSKNDGILRAYCQADGGQSVAFIDKAQAELEATNWILKFPVRDPISHEPFAGDSAVIPVYSYTHPSSTFANYIRLNTAKEVILSPAMYPIQFPQDDNFAWAKGTPIGSKCMAPLILISDMVDGNMHTYDIARPCPRLCPAEYLGQISIP